MDCLLEEQLGSVLEGERSTVSPLHQIIVQQHLTHRLCFTQVVRVVVAASMSSLSDRLVDVIRLAPLEVDVASSTTALQVKRASDIPLQDWRE